MATTPLTTQPLTRDGNLWSPSYLLSIDSEICIGCGRCFKVCGKSVMELRGITEDGELVELDSDEEIERKIMVVANEGFCIGCAACARVCPKNCQKHGPS
jgi:Nif-specific ferredoxin III